MPTGVSGGPGLIGIDLSKITEFDHEIIKLLNWVKDNHKLMVYEKRMHWVSITNGVNYSFESTEAVLLHYKQIKENAEH